MENSCSCLNCENPLKEGDRFCAACGQEKKEIHVSLAVLLGEFFSSALSVRGKLLSTCRGLLLQPGRMTIDFMEGKRIGVISPIKLFLWCSVIYFLVAGVVMQLHPVQLPLGDLTDGDSNYNLRLGGEEIRMKESEWVKLSNANDEDFAKFLNERQIEPNSWTAFMLKRLARLMGAGGIDKFRQTVNQVLSNMAVVAMPIFGILVYLGFFHRVQNMVHAMVFSAHVHAFSFLALALTTLTSELHPILLTKGLAILLIVPYCILAARRAFPDAQGKVATWFSPAMAYIVLISLTELLIYLMVLAVFGLLVIVGSLAMM